MNLVLDTILPPAYLSLALVGLGILLIIFAGGTSDRRELSKLKSAAKSEHAFQNR